MSQDVGLEMIQAARSRDDRLTIEAYCRAAACSLREVTIAVKDYDDTLLTTLARTGLTCPQCRRRLVVHAVRTGAEQIAYEDREARESVNVQRHERDHGPGFCLDDISDELPQ